MKHTWIIDWGHGGLLGGKYQTYPDKMYVHSDSEIAYEGVINRIIGQQLIAQLNSLGIPSIILCPTTLDLALDLRIKTANEYHYQYHNCVGISLHSNASDNHKARGFEIHTYLNESLSDKHAEILGMELIASFPQIPYRMGDRPEEYDKDSNLYILRWTQFPFILPECLFFDNYEDYRILTDIAFQREYVNALVRYIQKAELALP